MEKSMKHHDIVSSLYSIREMINCHLSWLRDSQPVDAEVRDEKNLEILEKAYFQICESLQLTEDFKQIFPGKTDQAERKTDVCFAWRNALSFLSREGLTRDVEVIERIPEDFPQINCDPGELEEIFYHLAKNACQILSKGKLIVRAQLGFDSQEKAVAIISVIDTGGGIPRERFHFLFEPFYTTKPCGNGNGLGLWLVRKFVQKNSGTISIQTFEGYGTTFSLYFPLRTAKINSLDGEDKGGGGTCSIK